MPSPGPGCSIRLGVLFQMSSCENSDHRVSVLDLNSDLQQAQVELLSAHCTVHQLRLHYSSDDLARFGRREVLRRERVTVGMSGPSEVSEDLDLAGGA